MPDYRRQQGQICEAILSEWLLRNNYWILRPYAGQGPVDVAAISEEGDIYLFDAKKDARRVNPGRKTRTRIHRVRSDIQNRLGVRMAYVDVDTREVHIVPEIDEKTPQHIRPGGVAIEYDDGLGET
jgi:hypothetical protein